MENKLWFAKLEVGFCGMDGAVVFSMPADASDEEVQDEAYQYALQHAESYGYYPTEDCDGMDDEEMESCSSDGIEGYAVPYDPELHDRYRSGVGSFMEDFE